MTPIVCPRTWAENGDVAVTTTAVCTSTTTHRRRSQKNTPRVDRDTEPTTSYLQQRELGLLILIEEPRFCGHVIVFGPCSRAHDRCHNRPQCVFLPPPRVWLRVNFGYPITYVIGSAGCGVFCYAVLCPLSGGLCGLLCRVMPWSGACV